MTWPNNRQFQLIQQAIASVSDQRLCANGQLVDLAGAPIKSFANDRDQRIRESVGKYLSVDGKSCDTLVISVNNELTCLDFLRYCPRIEVLQITFCQSLKCIQGISALKNLSCVSLMGCVELEDIAVLGNHNQLCSLDLSLCNQLTTDQLQILLSLDQLTTLKLNGVEFLSDLEIIKQLKKLERLSLLDCPKLFDIEGIQELKSLVFLAVGGCKFTDLSPLYFLPHLRSLHLDTMHNLKHLNSILGMSKLDSLAVTNCNELVDASGADHLVSSVGANVVIH